MWNFIPKIEIPIFNAGRNKANLKLAEIRQQQSVVNYEQKIQSAFKQVADALALRDSINQQLAAQQRYLDSLRITLQRARGLYSSGAVSYIEVLDAERSLSLPSKIFSTLFMPGRLMKLISSPRSAAVGSNNLI
jgi:Cu(I)/Ag(I) efflux system outer membrane protein